MSSYCTGCQVDAEVKRLRSELAALKARQGEPVGEVDSAKHNRARFYLGNAALPVGTKLYTSAPSIPAAISQAHALCNDLGIAQGHIEDRLFEAIGKINENRGER